MTDWIHAIILGLIEGLTEFIPVSSTGMLLLAKTALGLTEPFWDTFAVLIQLGAILAVVVLYFRRLWSIALLIPTEPRARNFVPNLNQSLWKSPTKTKMSSSSTNQPE